VPQEITQCRQGRRTDIGGGSKPRRRAPPHRRSGQTSKPESPPSGRRQNRSACSGNEVARLADRLMNGDAMREPRMPGAQKLTEHRPVGVLERCCTTKRALTRAAGTTAKLRRRPSSTPCRSPRRKASGPRDDGQSPLVGHPPRREYRLSGQIHTSTPQCRARDFHAEKLGNDTHASTTDPDAWLFRKGRGKEAKLCHMA
jgi:hypothetical protein